MLGGSTSSVNGVIFVSLSIISLVVMIFIGVLIQNSLGLVILLTVGVLISLGHTSFFRVSHRSILRIESPIGNSLVALTLILFLLCLVVCLGDLKIASLCMFIQLVLILTFKVNKILLFYFCFEARAIPILVIIINWGYSPERYTAAVWIVVYTVAGRLPFLYVVLGKYSDILLTRTVVDMFRWQESVMLLLPFLVKFPLFGVHYWLPLAHVEAPLIGSMLLAGILLKLGGYGILVVFSVFTLRGVIVARLVLWSLVGGFVVCLHIIISRDIKKFIALRSVAHINVRILGVCLGYRRSILASKVILIRHGLCRALLFYLANVRYVVASSRALFLIKGMINLIPLFCLMLILFCSVNIAAPPSLRFIRELFLCPALVYSQPIIVILFIGGLFMAVLYSMYLYYAVAHGYSNYWSYYCKDLNTKDYTIISLPLFGLLFLIFCLEFF